MKYKINTNLNELIIDSNKPLFFDSETIGLYGEIRLVQFYQEQWECPILIERPDIIQLTALLKKNWIIGHLLNYDLATLQEQLENLSINVNNFDDTYYLSRLYFYNKEKFTLDKCLEYSNERHIVKTEMVKNLLSSVLISDKSELQKSDWNAVTLTEEQLMYAANDVYCLLPLWHIVKECADTQSYKLDIKTVKLCLNFQCNGLPVDKDKLCYLHKKNMDEIAKINLPINSNSYTQVRSYIDSQSSDDEGLARLEAQGSIKAKEVRRTRKLIKENSFLNKFNTYNDKIYGKFYPGARSGRCVCKDQNLQQLPRNTKQVFGIPENGPEVLLYVDFSQLELRCIAAITGDEYMTKLYMNNEDVHLATAINLFNTQQPTKEQRRIAKTCNFALLYGAGVNIFLKILLTSTGMILPESSARQICYKWKSLFTSINEWQQKGIRAFHKQTIWQTPLGRKYKAKLMTDQLNIQVQGMGSEVAKLANYYMVKDLEKLCKESSTWQRNFIHDAYIFVLPNDELLYKPAAVIIAKAMQTAWSVISGACKTKNIPMPVSVDVGFNWSDIENGTSIIYTYKR